MSRKKPLVGSLGYTTNGTDHLCFVPGIGERVADPRLRSALLLAEWENDSSASTGPLPWGPSVLHSALKCAARENQPVGLGWVASLTAAAVEAWTA